MCNTVDSLEERYKPDIDDSEEKKDIKGLIQALENEDFLIRKDAAI